MTLYEYIASNNPYKANDLLSGYGFEESDSISTIASRLKLLVRKYKKIHFELGSHTSGIGYFIVLKDLILTRMGFYD